MKSLMSKPLYLRKTLPALAVMAVLLSAWSVPAQARDYRDYYKYDRGGIGGFMDRHPYVQKAVVGGGAGAALGAIVARDGNRMNTAAKGALIGAGAGMGYELLRRKGVF